MLKIVNKRDLDKKRKKRLQWTPISAVIKKRNTPHSLASGHRSDVHVCIDSFIVTTSGWYRFGCRLQNARIYTAYTVWQRSPYLQRRSAGEL